MAEVVLIAKDLTSLLWNILLSAILLYFISHIIMAVIKTLFFDMQIKLYRVLKKKLNENIDDVELQKYIDKLKSQLPSNQKKF